MPPVVSTTIDQFSFNMNKKRVLFHHRFTCRALLFLCLAMSVRNEAHAQTRLDDPERFVKVAIRGITAIKKTGDVIRIQTNPTEPQASLIFSLGSGFDPRKNNLFEITMRTGPRMPALFLFWRHAQSGPYDSVRQLTYRDGEFHTYVLPLDEEQSWRGAISEVALVWDAPNEVVEIKKLEFRPIQWTDRIRHHWSRFWFPAILNPATVNLIRGPVFMGISFSLALTLLFGAFVLLFYFVRRPVGWGKAGIAGADPRHRRQVWFQPAFWTLMALWVTYDLREAYDHIETLKSEVRFYLNTSDHPRHLLELDDLYDFLELVAQAVPLSKGIGFYSARPLFPKARYFLFPRRVADRTSNVDFVVVFQDPGVSFQDGKLTEKGKVVGDRLKRIGGFGENAFLLEKNHD